VEPCEKLAPAREAYLRAFSRTQSTELTEEQMELAKQELETAEKAYLALHKRVAKWPTVSIY
jgi:hypothetical protein